jgi:hypothetical protein
MRSLKTYSSREISFIFTEIVTFIRDNTDYSSMSLIAESINISSGYVYNLQSESSKVSDETKISHIVSLCQTHNVRFNYEKGEISFSFGFDKNYFTNRYIAIFWDAVTEKIVYVKLYFYESGYKRFEAYDINENIQYTCFERDRFYEIHNENINKKYIFEPIVFKGKDESINEFFIGVQKSQSYIGNLYISVPFSLFYKIEENVALIHSFLKDSELQSQIPTQIVTLEEFFESINLYNSRIRKIKIEIPEELLNPYQQFLSFFSEYVKIAKGFEIKFDILKKDNSLEIGFESHDIDTQKVDTYFQEYIGFTKQNIDNLKIEVEGTLSEKNFDLLILDLKQQINHLKHSLEIAALRNNLLSGEHQYFKQLVNMFVVSQLPSAQGNSVSDSEKEYYLNLVAKGKSKECIANLCELFRSKNQIDALKELIILSSRYMEVEQNLRFDVIKIQDSREEKNKINSALIDIIQAEL